MMALYRAQKTKTERPRVRFGRIEKENRMSTLKQPAMTKHPNGTASFLIRVASAQGSLWQSCLETPKPIAEAIEVLEKQIGYMRLLNGDKPESETV